MMALTALVSSIYGVVVSGASLLSIVLVVLVVLVLVLGLRALKVDQELLEKMEQAAMDANQGVLESRVVMIPKGHRLAECAWAINEMLDQTETVFRDTSSVLTRMAGGDYGRRPQPVGLRGAFPALLNTVIDVQHRVERTMDALAHVMEGLGGGDLSVRMDNKVEKLFRDQVNSAMVSIDEILRQFAELVGKLAQGDVSQRMDLGRAKGDLKQLALDINLSMESFEQAISGTMAAAERIGKGDLTQQIDGDYRGALGALKDSINATQVKLSEIVSEVRKASAGVKNNAKEVSSGSHDLASRTSEQAASLEQTAASMEEIASTVNLSADSAALANKLAEESVIQVNEGTRVIGDAVHAMEGINESSSKISEIISLIDGIAFQTNLLALNAAVEAARAGEHGRGFAVVAGEVRSLAQRSADAAKDIKELIEDSTSRIEEGSRLVGQSGGSLTTIQGSIKKMNDIASEIAAAAREQTQGIDQVNSAVAQLDGVTQENAALVEETAAASEQLNTQADQLSNMVSFFKLDSRYQQVSAEPAPARRAAAPQPAKAAAAAPAPRKAQAAPAPRPAAAAGKDSEWDEF
jgi:methyl-accepting chemotaxis protein